MSLMTGLYKNKLSIDIRSRRRHRWAGSGVVTARVLALFVVSE